MLPFPQLLTELVAEASFVFTNLIYLKITILLNGLQCVSFGFLQNTWLLRNFSQKFINTAIVKLCPQYRFRDNQLAIGCHVKIVLVDGRDSMIIGNINGILQN